MFTELSPIAFRPTEDELMNAMFEVWEQGRYYDRPAKSAPQPKTYFAKTGLDQHEVDALLAAHNLYRVTTSVPTPATAA